MIKDIPKKPKRLFQSKDCFYVLYKLLNNKEIHNEHYSIDNVFSEIKEKSGFPSGILFLYGDSRYITAEYNPSLIKEPEIRNFLEKHGFKIEKIKDKPFTKIFGLEFHL